MCKLHREEKKDVEKKNVYGLGRDTFLRFSLFRV